LRKGRKKAKKDKEHAKNREERINSQINHSEPSRALDLIIAVREEMKKLKDNNNRQEEGQITLTRWSMKRAKERDNIVVYRAVAMQ
jgi:hypothetical protein